MTDRGPAFPFEKQETGWMCGAASLCMAYRSLDLAYSQRTIWSDLAPAAPGDRSGVPMSRLCRDALGRGLSAVACRAKQPWATLEACQRSGARVVLDQPLAPGSMRRHFTVLVHLGEDHLILYDPLLGPDRRVAKGDFLDAWGANYGNSKATVQGLVAITRPEPEATNCAACGTPIPAALSCHGCGRNVPLRPAAALGCIAASCPARLWWRVYCPHCDAALSGLADGAPADGSEDEMADPVDFRKIASAMEGYQERLSAAQAAATDPGLREQIGALSAHLKTAGDQLTETYKKMNETLEESTRRSRERAEAATRKAEEVARARAEALRRLEAKKARKASAARTPARKLIDPHLGAKLRDKLLDEFGSRAELGPARGLGDSGSLLDYEPGG